MAQGQKAAEMQLNLRMRLKKPPGLEGLLLRFHLIYCHPTCEYSMILVIVGCLPQLPLLNCSQLQHIQKTWVFLRWLCFISILSLRLNHPIPVHYFFCDGQDMTESLDIMHQSLFNIPMKFYFFGGRLQKKLFVLYKFQ